MKARGTVLSKRIAHASTVSDWGTLKAGDQIEVVKHAHVIAAGEVREVSLSGNVLWMESSAPGKGERLFMKSDGVQVRRA